jgi:glycylpeptide N-tetradecanoyltransferase
MEEKKNNKEETFQEEKDISKNLEKLAIIEKAKKKLEEMNPNKPHRFWDNQPVPKLKEEITESEMGPIDKIKTMDEIKKEPYNLPQGFEWTETDVDDPKVVIFI